jgi:type IV pilus assembly protein PilY1
MFKDTDIGLLSTRTTPITELQLYDATSNAIQEGDDTTSSAALSALQASSGWMLALGTGEKVIGSSVTLAGTTFFNTNQPSSVVATCGSELGRALQYAISYEDATVPIDASIPNPTAADRSIQHGSGGYLPSPVPVVVNLDGKLHQAVVSGTSVRIPPQADLESRYRFYWYIRRD